MPQIQVVFLWHQHQPFYKDLVTGRYRLPWVRLHALKDYFGIVKLLDEFPGVHQTINLVPSLIAQIEDYASGAAQDPFLALATRPADDLLADEQAFVLSNFFHANPHHMIARYPRYQQLQEQVRAAGGVESAQRAFSSQDYTDLQVLSQLAWFDEFFLKEPEIAALVEKGRQFTLEDQAFVIAQQQSLIARVLPAHRSAQDRGLAEISTTPYYHPILPLLCDTDQGRVSSHSLPLPQEAFRHPEDAQEQLRRSIALHERVFGRKPNGCWPSEGSVSEEVVSIAHGLGFQWMATDEGVLGRSLGSYFHRDSEGRLADSGADRLYQIYRYERGSTGMHLLFRDHTLSDLIGFVYANVDAKDAAQDMLLRIRRSAEPVLAAGRDAVVPIILDGENAWEFYPKSGREFLRRLYDGISSDPRFAALTVSEAIARQSSFGRLDKLIPGSWINANFNIWIGAPEDNRSWDYLKAARDFYTQTAPTAEPAARELAYEELLIAEGSDWNWWYGPEHHSANDADFDDLYRKHLANVYTALGATPPDYLAQPISRATAPQAFFTPQTEYISPRIEGSVVGYFDWLGAATYVADRRSSAMHGKEFLLEALHAGINEEYFFGRVDFAGGIPQDACELQITVEGVSQGYLVTGVQINAAITAGRLDHCRLLSLIETASTAASGDGQEPPPLLDLAASGFHARLLQAFEFRLRLSELHISQPRPDNIRMRCAIFRDRLPVDMLPLDGSIELVVATEGEMRSWAV